MLQACKYIRHKLSFREQYFISMACFGMSPLPELGIEKSKKSHLAVALIRVYCAEDILTNHSNRITLTALEGVQR